MTQELFEFERFLMHFCWSNTGEILNSSWQFECINSRVAVHVQATVYPKKYAHGFCFAVLCCGYTLTDFPISIRLTSLALWQSNDCPSASKATLVNMDKYFMWIHYEWLHNHNKAKHNKTICIFLGIYCTHIISDSMANNGIPVDIETVPWSSVQRQWYHMTYL